MAKLLEVLFVAIGEGQKIASDKVLTYGELAGLVTVIINAAGLKDQKVVKF